MKDEKGSFILEIEIDGQDEKKRFKAANKSDADALASAIRRFHEIIPEMFPSLAAELRAAQRDVASAVRDTLKMRSSPKYGTMTNGSWTSSGRGSSRNS